MLKTTMKVPTLQTLALCAVLSALVLPAPRAEAAVGCALTNPEDDLRSFFPGMTDFSTRYLTFQAQAPDNHGLLERDLGDPLDPVYETADVPYTLYAVRKSGQVLGYVFGANQRGTYSNIQVIAVTERDLSLRNVYLQKIRSPLWESFRSEGFSEALSARSLESYPTLRDCYVKGECDDVGITDPTAGKETGDFRAILRALAKLHVLSRLLLEPGVERPGRDDQARSERVSSWWHGEPTGPAIQTPRWCAPGQSPWPDEEPVLLWRGDGDGVIVPLSVLGTHPVVNVAHMGREIAFTWSPYQDTAVGFERPQGARFEPTSEVLHGVMLVTATDDRSQWSPALGASVRGAKEPRATDLLTGLVRTSHAQAVRLAPQARVLLSDPRDDPKTLIEVRARLQALGTTSGERALVIASGRSRHGIVLPDTGSGIERLQIERRAVALVHFDGHHAAFEEREPSALIFVGRDPFSGAPWLWDRSQESLHEGLTGRVLSGPQRARPLRPLTVYGMAAASFKALHPGMPLQTLKPR